MTRYVVVAVLAILALGCGPAARRGPDLPPLPSSLPSHTTGWYVRLTALDARTQVISRDVNCTMVGKAAGKVVMVTDKKTGLKAPYTLLVTLHVPDESRLYITEEGGVELVEFTCSMFGQTGDSLDCEATVAATGRIAPVIHSKDFDKITDPRDGFAICTGTINARA